MQKTSRRSRRKFSITVIAVVCAVFSMLFASVSASALTITPDMMQSVQDFLAGRDLDELTNDTLNEFVENFITTEQEKGNEQFSDEKINSLMNSVRNHAAEVQGQEDISGKEYAYLVQDILKQDADEDVNMTLNTVLDVVHGIENLDEETDYVNSLIEREQASSGTPETPSTPLPTYRVEWYVGDVLVQTDTCYDRDLYQYPAEDGQIGEHIVWENHGAFFRADKFTADEIRYEGETAIYMIQGTLVSVMEEVASAVNKVDVIRDIFTVTADPTTHQLTISANMSQSDYRDAFDRLRAALRGEGTAETKEQLKNLVYELALTFYNTGINQFMINGHPILTIESYDANDLLTMLNELSKGENVNKYIHPDAVADLLLEQSFTDLIDGICRENLNGQAHLTLLKAEVSFADLDYVHTADWSVRVGLAGSDAQMDRLEDAVYKVRDAVRQLTDRINELIDLERLDNRVNVHINLDSAFLQLLLDFADIDELTAQGKLFLVTVTDPVTGKSEEMYMISDRMTVGDLKTLLKNVNYERVLELVGDLSGDVLDRVLTDELKDRALSEIRSAVDKVLTMLPTGYDDKTLSNTYTGVGSVTDEHGSVITFSTFDFGEAAIDKEATVDRVKQELRNRLNDGKLVLAGRTIDLEAVIDSVARRVVNSYLGGYDGEMLESALTLDWQNYFRYTIQTVDADGNVSDLGTFFIRGGEYGVTVFSLETVLGITSAEGHGIVRSINGKTVTADATLPEEDALLVFSQVPHVYELTWHVQINGTTLTTTAEYAYGTVLVEDELLSVVHALLKDHGVDPRQYSLDIPTRWVVDGDGIVDVTATRRTATVTWTNANGDIYASVVVNYGERVPAYSAELIPINPDMSLFLTNAFSGWSLQSDSMIEDGLVYGDIVYVATFDRMILPDHIEPIVNVDGQIVEVDLTDIDTRLPIDELFVLLTQEGYSLGLQNEHLGEAALTLVLSPADMEAILAACTEAGDGKADMAFSYVVTGNKQSIFMDVQVNGQTIHVPQLSDNVHMVTVPVSEYFAKGYSELFIHMVDNSVPNGVRTDLWADESTVVQRNDDGTLTVIFKAPHYSVLEIEEVRKQAPLTEMVQKPVGGTVNVTVNGAHVSVGDHILAGDTVTIAVAVHEGYRVASVKVNGEVINAVNGVYTFEMGVDGISIEVTYEIKVVFEYHSFAPGASDAYDDLLEAGTTIEQWVALNQMPTLADDMVTYKPIWGDTVAYAFVMWLVDGEEADPASYQVTAPVTFAAVYEETLLYTISINYRDGSGHELKETVRLKVMQAEAFDYHTYYVPGIDMTVGAEAVTYIFDRLIITYHYSDGSTETETYDADSLDGLPDMSVNGNLTFDAIYAESTESDSESETEPDTSETEPDTSETEPESSETDPESSETDPESSETDPESSETDPESSETDPESSETDPESSETDPESSETDPESSETDPESSETDPESSETDPESSETDPESSETDPESSETDPESSETQPVIVEPSDSDSESEDDEAGGCRSTLWWVILLIVLLLLLVGVVIFVLLGRKKKEPEEPMPEPEVEESADILYGDEEAEVPEIRHVEDVTVEAADALMTDAVAAKVLETMELPDAREGKMDIVNIDALNEQYAAGDTVTLDNLKEKGMISDKAERVKVLASGHLNKALTVEADAFSLQAIKMIVLTGGHAVKLGHGKMTVSDNGAHAVKTTQASETTAASDSDSE